MGFASLEMEENCALAEHLAEDKRRGEVVFGNETNEKFVS